MGWSTDKGRLLKEIIKSKGFSVRQVSKDTGISENLLYQITLGYRTLSKVNLIKIAGRVGMSEELMLKLLEKEGGITMSPDRVKLDQKEKEFWWQMSFHHFDDLIKDPMVSVIRNPGANDYTPLHFMATYGFLGCLDHADFAVVTNVNGDTPMHFFCDLGLKRISEKDTTLLIHVIKTLSKMPEFTTVKNKNGETPEDVLCSWEFSKKYYVRK